MSGVAKALWYIESYLARPLSLSQIARASGLSPFHLSRLFGHATGHSVLGYVRGRRLTEAARRLSAGAPDILSVALEAGYGSHEAFTRAFRDRFGLTPEAVRAARETSNLPLLESIRMSAQPRSEIAPQRIESAPAMILAGIRQAYRYDNTAGIPAQWQRFEPYIELLPRRDAERSYGVCLPAGPQGFDYLCGVEVSASGDLPRELARVEIPAARYAVFFHADHVASIQSTCAAIFSAWLPGSGHALPEDGPSLIEVYDGRFDPRTGLGGVEIWIPLQS